MMEQEQLQEVQELGETVSEPPPIVKRSIGCGYLLFQAAVCVLLLFGLTAVKLADPARFAKLSLWVSTELNREIELPHFTDPLDTAALQSVQIC